jgi:hypothetical protein
MVLLLQLTPELPAARNREAAGDPEGPLAPQRNSPGCDVRQHRPIGQTLKVDIQRTPYLPVHFATSCNRASS